MKSSILSTMSPYTVIHSPCLSSVATLAPQANFLPIILLISLRFTPNCSKPTNNVILFLAPLFLFTTFSFFPPSPAPNATFFFFFYIYCSSFFSSSLVSCFTSSPSTSISPYISLNKVGCVSFNHYLHGVKFLFAF